MKQIYFDHNATTPVDPLVVEAMKPYWIEEYGNPSSTHKKGQRAKYALEQARALIQKSLNLTNHDFFITSGGTESNNLAILGMANAYTKPMHIIASAIEHPSVLLPLDYLEKERGWKVSRIDPDVNGVIAEDAILSAIEDDTVLISVMHANNETGVIQPIVNIINTIKERGIAFHCDISQAIGKMVLPEYYNDCTYLTVSSHKIYGPKGIGGLAVKKGAKLKPIIFGGHQENNIRPGTENVALSIGFAKACQIVSEANDEFYLAIAKMRDDLASAFLKEINECHWYGSGQHILPNTLSMGFGGVDGIALAMALDIEHVYVSTGSACTAGSIDPSHVLIAMGETEARAKTVIRFSLGRKTTQEEIVHCSNQVIRLVKQIRSKS